MIIIFYRPKIFGLSLPPAFIYVPQVPGTVSLQYITTTPSADLELLGALPFTSVQYGTLGPVASLVANEPLSSSLQPVRGFA